MTFSWLLMAAQWRSEHPSPSTSFGCNTKIEFTEYPFFTFPIFICEQALHLHISSLHEWECISSRSQSASALPMLKSIFRMRLKLYLSFNVTTTYRKMMQINHFVQRFLQKHNQPLPNLESNFPMRLIEVYLRFTITITNRKISQINLFSTYVPKKTNYYLAIQER